MENKPYSHLLFLHFSIMLFGGTALFAKLIPLNALDISAYRALVAAVSLFSILIILQRPIKLNTLKDTSLMVMLGLIIALHWVTYFMSIQLATVALGIIVFFTYPVITIFLEPLICKTQLKLQDVISGFIVILGIYLLLPDFDLNSNLTLGIISALLSALFFSIRNILHHRYCSQYSGAQAMSFQTLVAGLVLIYFIDITPQEMSTETLFYLLVVGTLFTAAPHALFAAALRNISAKTVSLISCLQPLYATLFAFIILNEIPRWQTLLGGVLIIATAIYHTFSNIDSQHSQEA